MGEGFRCGGCPRRIGKAVEQGSGHFGVAEYPGPLAEAEIGGDDDASALVKTSLAEPISAARS